MNSNSEIPQQINEVDTAPSSDRDDLSTNGTGTDSKSDTPLTQPSSLDVRRDLIALRTKHGADTPIGHRCSNLVEMIDCPYPPVVMIRRQMAELQRLLAAR